MNHLENEGTGLRGVYARQASSFYLSNCKRAAHGHHFPISFSDWERPTGLSSILVSAALPCAPGDAAALADMR
jgi:hypothetical protein